MFTPGGKILASRGGIRTKSNFIRFDSVRFGSIIEFKRN